jgi:hypothetical protein
LTDIVVGAVRAYLSVRGLATADHLFLYGNAPVCKDLIRSRLKVAGERVGVKVYPHRLRHTTATQRLNAGCRVTTIQKLLGHQPLNSTMVYDRTVAEDYYAAMEVVEKRLEAISPKKGEDADLPVNGDERAHLLELATQLAEPNLSIGTRLDLVDQMCQVLNHRTPPEEKLPMQQESGRQPPAPP